MLLIVGFSTLITLVFSVLLVIAMYRSYKKNDQIMLILSLIAFLFCMDAALNGLAMIFGAYGIHFGLPAWHLWR